MKEYTERQASGFLLFGIILGIFSALWFAWTIRPTILLEATSELESPKRIYEVTVDDVMFTCMQKPRIRNTTVILQRCAESFGTKVVVRKFSSYSIEVVE